KALLDIVAPYGPYAKDKGFPPPTGVNEIFYADAGTYTGADPNTLFDADDELVFMAKDAGGKFSGLLYPNSTIINTGLELKIADPLGGVGYVYLFQQDGSLSQDAGVSYVNYNFRLSNGGTYPQNFTFLGARNNENTTVSTSNYEWHFSAEWISDNLKIKTGGATGIDLLDRHKSFFGNNNCNRSEDTFSEGDNTFVTNKVGPIRVIRSYMGANSGPLTQRTNIFYQARQDIITDLRVHNIAIIYDAFDYNVNTDGMKYRNNLNTGGVIINGSKDAVTLGDITWELVTGTKEGSLVILHRRKTNLKASDAQFTSYYDDNKTKPASNCTGDGQAWGTSGIGIQFQGNNVCTDPLSSNCGVSSIWFRKMSGTRVIYFEASNASTTTATNYNNQMDNPLVISPTPLTQLVLSTQNNQLKLSLTDAEQQLSLYNMKISPNPAKGACTLSFYSGERFRTDVVVLDIMGKMVMKRNFMINEGFNSYKLPAGQLTPGLYYICLISKEKMYSEKLVVQ
ncbi:MAG: T9SS type A sorting domain-containing protein, partial [Flavisolibacter sp.]|nr:T9SS type A sorting domain-containing protein [Flavisolibacter sp.]